MAGAYDCSPSSAGKCGEGASVRHVRGTSGAHQREICPETLRTAEISRPHVTWHVGCIGRGQAAPGTRSGLQTDSAALPRDAPLTGVA